MAISFLHELVIAKANQSNKEDDASYSSMMYFCRLCPLHFVFAVDGLLTLRV